MAGEDRVYRPCQRRFGAVVHAQGVHPVRAAGGIDVGEDVGAAEAVDRLLGIADQQQRVRVVAEKGIEDEILYGVGILKLVDQCGMVALPHGITQHGACRAAQRAVHGAREIVERADIPRSLDLRKPSIDISGQGRAKRHQVRVQLGAKQPCLLHKLGASVEERMARRGAALLCLLPEYLVGQQLAPVEQQRVGGRKEYPQGGEECGDPRRFVAGALEPPGAQQLGGFLPLRRVDGTQGIDRPGKSVRSAPGQ